MAKRLRMPERRGIWLYSYDQIKHQSRIEWIGSLLIGLFFLALGVPLGFAMWQMSADYSLIGRTTVMVVPSAFGAVAFIQLPAALIYFYRKSRGIPVDIWDCETPNDPAVREEHSHEK